LPQLEVLSGKYGGMKLRMILIDASDRAELTRKVIDEAAVSAPVLLDDKDVTGESYGVFATPTTFIIDPAGRIIFKHVGFDEGMEAVFDREIDLLLQRA
jgi:peroxiredoxin